MRQDRQRLRTINPFALVYPDRVIWYNKLMTTGDFPDFGHEEPTPDPIEILKQNFREGLGKLDEETSARMRAHIEAEVAKSPEAREAPSESPKAEELLDDLFNHAILGDPESNFEDVPDHIAVNFVDLISQGVECFQILNWETKDKFSITRPSIGSVDLDDLGTSIDGEPNLIYRIVRSNLFNLPYPHPAVTEDGEDKALEEIVYEVSGDRIVTWGDTSYGEIVALEDVAHGTPGYKRVLDRLLDHTYIDKLASGLFG